MKKILGCIALGAWVLLTSCGGDDEFADTYRQDVISYFQHVALGFEIGNAPKVTRKWNTDMKLFVGGKPDQTLRSELDRVIAEINTLAAADGFNITLVTDTLQSNAYVFFGTQADFVEMFPGASEDAANNFGLFYVKFNDSDHIYNTVIFIDLVRVTEVDVRKHLLREELTQSLGLARDSYQYPASIFQQSWTKVTEYAPIDRDLIRLLYNPSMATGLDKEHVEPVLNQLTIELAIGNP